MRGVKVLKNTKKRKKFILSKTAIRQIAKGARSQGVSKNAYLIEAIGIALGHYKRENLFFYVLLSEFLHQRDNADRRQL